MTETRLPIHPYADLFPPLSSPEFDRLCGDVAANGLHEEIVIHEGKVLDGRHRYLACLARQVTPRFRDYAGEGGSPLAFVVAKNLIRRHLTESQRALLAARLKPMFEEEARQRRQSGLKRGTECPVPENSRERGKPDKNAESARKAADLMKVSDFSVRAADKVEKQGLPELVGEVVAGKVSVSAAARIAVLPAEQQKKVVTAIQSGLKPKQALAQVQEMPQDGTPLVDDNGQALPEQAIPAFQQRKELRALCRRLATFHREVARLKQSAIGVHFDAEYALACLDNIEGALSACQPAYLCPRCRGTEQGCDLCQGHGWVTAAIYQNA